MNIFVNGFNVVKRNDDSEIVLFFTQSSPVLDEAGSVTGTEQERVGSFVMSRDLALNFCTRTLELLNNRPDPPQAKAEE